MRLSSARHGCALHQLRMKSLDPAQYIRCRFSAWFMSGLCGFWAILSFFALRWLGPMSRWEGFGPMEWLCVLWLVIHAALIVKTVWIWRHPKPEGLVLRLPPESGRGFGVGFVLGMGGIWFAAGVSGWRQVLAFVISSLALIVGVVAMSRELRAARRLEQQVLEKLNDGSN